MAKNVEEYCLRPENLGRRGIRTSARNKLVRTLEPIERAAGRLRGKGTNAVTARTRDFLKSLDHHADFDATIDETRAFVAGIRTIGRLARLDTEVRDREGFDCGAVPGVGEVRLRRLVSDGEVIEVARILGVRADIGTVLIPKRHRMFTELAHQEFWVLGTNSGTIALLTVHGVRDYRWVGKFQLGRGLRLGAKDGQPRALPGQVLRAVLREIEADGDSVPGFTRSGGFRSLVSADAFSDFREVVGDGRHYRIWRFCDEVILAECRQLVGGRHGPDVRWSRFVGCADPGGEEYEWRKGAPHGGAMEVAEFRRLLLRYPALRDAFAGSDEVASNFVFLS